MITLTLSYSAVTVHPKALPLDMPLRATIADVEPEEVLRHIEITEVVKHYGAQDLLSAIGWENVKEHFEL
jgi:hypothetical protein